MTRRPVRTLASVGAVAAALTACGYSGPTDLPLPAGTVAGDDPYPVTIVFADASSLTPKGFCRANDAPVGLIESVTLDEDLNARVVCRVNRSVTLPANAVGRLSETSLLGERYVALEAPAGAKPIGNLRPGAVLAEAGNHVDPTVEQVLGALSTVLNGGSLERVRAISRELTAALSGRGPRIRALLGELGTLVRGLNEHRSDITAALDSLDSLSGTLARQQKVIASAIDSVPDGLAVLERQRPRLVRLLGELNRLSAVATPLIERSKADAVADLELLRPILAALAESGDHIADALQVLPTYPFGSNALAAIKGDYVGVDVTLNLDLDSLNALLGRVLGERSQAAAPGSGRREPSDHPDLQLPGTVPPASVLDLGELLTGGG